MREARRFRSSNKSSMAPAPVFVQMCSEATRNLVLREARKLKGWSGMDRVYIKPDQTESERLLEKQLRTRRDELNKMRMSKVLFFDGPSFEDKSASIRLMYSNVLYKQRSNKASVPNAGSARSSNSMSNSRQAERASNC